MTTKFNKDMYAKMRAKKDEPLSNIGKKIIRVTGKGPSVVPPADATPIVSGVEGARVASPATSVEEISTPSSKRPRLSAKDKEKEKVGSSIFDDEGAAVERAHNIVRAEDLRVFSGVPVNVVAGQHVHKIVQVRSSLVSPGFFLCQSSPFFFTDAFFLLYRSSLFFLLTHLSSFVRCWVRAFTLPLSILLKRPRWLL